MSINYILYVIICFYIIILEKIFIPRLRASFSFIKQVVSSLAFRLGVNSVLINKYLLSFLTLANHEGTNNLFY